MRRWVCVLVLLFGFTSDSYAWTVRPRVPIAIQRGLTSFESRGGTEPTDAWWLPS